MKKWLALLMVFFVLFSAGCFAETVKGSAEEANVTFTYEEYPLERNGVALHLDCVSVAGTVPKRNILVMHGLTYSSHEFDINYEDYSLVRYLAGNGYAVWRLDIAGYGQSGVVEDGFMPDSDYAAEDIHAAVERIVAETGVEKVDLMGWSWGTVTTSRFVGRYPELVRKLVLYAPILCGLGEAEITEPFHENDWEHAAGDIQVDSEGRFDLSITDPVIIELLCSSSWHYDRDSSPNGGRRDLCVDPSVKLIDLSAIQMPTLVICGGNDPYMNYELVNASLGELPEGSELKIIPGGGHAIMIEKPYYHEFRESVLAFLDEQV